ncbi:MULTISPECIES: hemagglutinin repeat-containing protein [Pseudomonas]|uniref:Hemagglutinin repeat-containing protein n=1 Tax=Pseudomonas aphyarum TaxID=2942629 RepID=A0ABT5PKK5_9PSED|nr:hemagglutinin repeat-containing protein [Pseudomonas aphyarum]MDD0968534.1 hemagglutinin repeat-containing protein [Pseudomonas aphyarum]MDD1124434.1 hemagglutinin repeat-containing protein [Pseudomonas aphyarum]
MDVRQFAFLARLPSAAVKSRDQFCGMPKRGLAFLLANVMFWQPMWAQADGIVVANPGTTLDRAGNGVQIINIATPNGAGLSHNQFHDYNVGAQGVILNNGSNQASSTQLGGYVIDNPHLKNSGSAQAILNEVIGGSPSQLRGYTEVAGQSARVIVANPYGISCNGCGFINTPRVTLTTGKPVLDGSGRLDRFQVDQGSVAIEGAGLNATNVDRFEIITRTAKINAEIQAKNLTIVAGRNDVNADNLNATARADDGSAKPQLAIDSSALGGMYAGAIKLVGTEAGVGVKLDGKLIASGGDIQLDANGQLSLAETSATGAVNVKAASLETRSAVYAGTSLNVQTQGDLTNRQTLAARDSISLSAGGQLTNAGAIEAGVNADGSRNANGDLSLSAQAIDNRGKGLVASRNLTVDAAQTLNNQSGTLSGQNTRVTAGTLDNRNVGRVLGSASLNLNAGQVLNTQGVINSAGNLTGTVGQLINRNGELSSQGDTVLTVTSLDNVAGLMMAGRMLDITASGAINNTTGKLGGKTALNVRAQSLDNSQQGQLISEGTLTTRISGQLNNQSKGLIQANGAMDVQATRLDNRAGKISGLDNLTVSSANTDNRGGVIRSDKALRALVGELDNRDKGRLESKAALTFEGNKLDNRNGGLLTSTGLMTLKAGEVSNAAGRMSGKADIDANIDTLNQQGGELVAEGNLLLTGKNLDNRQDGLVGSLKNLTVNVEQIDNRGGSLSSQQALLVNGARLDNSEGGKVLSDTTLGLKVAQIINATNGLIFSKGASTLSGIGLSNVGGRIVSQADLQLSFDEAMDNQGGLISSEGRLTLKVGSLDNRLGKLSSLEAMALTSTGAVLNQGGLIASQKGLVFNSGSLDNSDQGIISAKADSTLTTGEFKNRHEGSLATDGTLQLKAAHLDNSGGRIGSQQQLDVSVTSLEQDGGELFSNADLTLDMNHGVLNNQRGNLHTPGQLLLKNLAEVNNSAGEISGANAWSLNAQSLNNDGGKLLSNQKLTLVVDQALSNIKGLIASASLESRSASLNNTGGEIRGRGEVDLTVTDLFDNQAGVVIADDGLRVTAARLDNRQEGLVGSTKALTLTVDRVDNRSGELSSKAGVSLIGAWLDNSDSGYIAAGGNLALTVGQVINRNKGLMGGDSGLTLTGQTLENSGRLSSGKDLAITLSSDLNNNQGSLISEGALAINAQRLSNNGGTLSSAKNLTVDTRGAVSNQGGKLLTDTALTINSSVLDNQQKGVISSKTGLNINTGDLNNRQGSIYSADRLELSADQVTNTGGSIGAANSLVANLKGLDQQGGKLFSTGDLSLDLKGGALNNQDGFVTAPGQLLLKNLGEVNNRGGDISSEQAFDLIAASLDNSGGQVLSNQKLTLTIDKALSSIKGKIAAAALQIRAASLDNSDGGVLLSDSDLEVTVDGLLSNRNKGSIKAAQQLTLNSTGLDNQGGELVGIAGLAIDLGSSAQDLNNQDGMISSKGLLSIAHLRDLNNQSGVINSKGVLSIATLRALNNQKGEISSVNSFSLTGNSLDNRGGNLISNDQLTLTAPELKNQGGLISGWKGVTVTGGTLDNSQEGSVSSLLGNLNIDLSGALINHSNGGLGGVGEVTIKATRLDNTSGTVTSGGKQTLTITGGTISNGAGGFIESGDSLDVRAATLNNAGGRITANKALTFTGTQLDNSGGSLVGKDSVTLDLLGALTNVNGALGSTGPLVIKRSASVDNRGGQLISQSLLDLLTHGDLNNSAGGTISANGQLDLKADGTLHNNADGLISSRDAAVNLTAAALNNGKGAVQSFTALTVNTGTGAIDNQGGKLIAQTGDLNITAASLDNRGGMLSSLKGLLQTRLTGVLRNGQGGKIEGSRLDLRALGGIYSDGGRIAANTGDILLNAGTNALDNSGGGIYAKGQVKVSAGSMNNSAGQVSGSVIDLGAGTSLTNRGGLIESAGTLAVRATNLDNQSGKLRALGTSGKTDFQIGSLFDNRNGLVETANTNFTLAAPSFLNAGGSVTHVGAGEFDISTANVMNAGGSLVTRGGLTLNADSWTNSSVIQAGRLTLNINNFTQTASGQVLASNQLTGRGVNWYNDGLIASDGGMDIQLGGRYGGNGRISSVGTMGLSASQIDVTAAASITGASDSTIISRGSLTNFGRITSADRLTVNADALTNNGTLGSAGRLRINSNSLLNQNGLIFSGEDMALRVGTLTNRYADIYGMGNISIARDDSNGWSSSINNISGTIESTGDLSLAADHIENRKDVFEVAGGGLISGTIGVRCTTCTSFSNVLRESNLPSHMVWVEKYQSTIVKDSAAGTLTAGRNLVGSARDFINDASVVSAGRDLTLNVQNFTNQGATVGDYTVTRWFDSPGSKEKNIFFWEDVLAYNAANDPNYDSGKTGVWNGKIVMVPTIHTWDMNEVESLTAIRSRQGGGEAPRFYVFGSIILNSDAKFFYPGSSYASGVRTEAPSAVKNATFFRNTTVESSPSANANAVVQAGGTVYINATNKLDNGVVRNGNASAGGASRLGSTQLGGGVVPTVIRINSQLPPDLAQQQVNPLSLPGFTLPTGENGLFRLSHKGGSEQDLVANRDWTIGTIAASATQRSDGMPARSATALQFDQNDPVSKKKRDLALSGVPSLNLNDKTAQFNVGPVAGDGPVGVLAPNRGQVSFDVPRVQGLPDTSVRSNPHKYLIETNPALTNLKQFMSSDYLLGKLGYDPDTSAKRLGDGLFEQRMVQQAVVARTGQRFIDGQTSDEAMFKYLMNNAVASKDQLNLSLGVTLTAQQVAALTHDIVWLEEHEVNGEKVLVPVLYLAQANNRLAPNGALIQGGDVTLIAGGDLNNAGTLRASNNLSAEAGNNLTNTGLIEAGERLTLKAGNDIINKSGGIISGKDVSLTATNGSVINQRDVFSIDSNRGGNLFHRDVLDNASRIEAANDLTIKSGKDINNIGGVLQSGRDMTLDADRDVNITSVQDRSTTGRGSSFLNQTITQHGAEVKSGRDLTISADRDVAVVGSRLDAKRDLGLNAGNDVLITSAANESEYVARSKRTQVESLNVSQQSSVINAGRDIAVSAGKDLNLIASRISASNEAYLFAGDDVNVETAEDVDYDYYSKTKKGSFGKKKSTMSESETVLSVSSTIEAGSKLVISGGQDVNLIGAKLNSDGTLLASAGRDINLLAAEDSHSQATASSKKGWSSSKSSSSEVTQTRLNSTELSAKNIELKSSHDITLQAAALRAVNEVKLTAENDVLIGAAQETQTSSQSKSSSKTGFTIGGELSSTRKTQHGQQSSTQNIGSDISAGSIQIKSGRDSVVEGSTLVADKNIGINAGRNLEITSAENSESSSSKSGSKKVGQIGSWWQPATGIVKTKEADQSTSTRQSGSQIASLGGDISLIAGDHYTQSASQLVTPQGDIGIKAKHVDIEAGFDTLNTNKTASTNRTAVGGTVSIPLVDALRGIQQMGEAAQKTSDDRMVALAAVNAAMSASQAFDAGQAMMQDPRVGVKVSVNLSNSQSSMNSSQSGRNVVGSDVVAGGNVSIVATGAGADSDINVVGSRIEGGGDVSLKADGDINLLSAQNTAHQESTNSNGGWSAGIGFGFGQSNGITFELAANKGRGSSDGDDVTHTNTSIKSGHTLNLQSGGDTNIKGAVANGETVKVKVGGDLNIESQQDTSTFTSKQLSANVGLSVCIPPFCVGTSSISGGIASQHMQSDYASVSEQSGIKAGNGGFQVEVAGNTDLVGAVIASTDKAVADGKNTLSTGTLTSSDIKNKAEYDASSINLSGGYGFNAGSGASNSGTANRGGPVVTTKEGANASAPIVLFASGNSSSTTHSGISGAAVTITNDAKQQELTGKTAEQTIAAINTNVSSDRDGSNKLKPIFDAQEIGVNFEIVGKFVQNVSQYIENRAQEADTKKKQADLELAASHDPKLSESAKARHRENYLKLAQEVKSIGENWGPGGTYRQIATALVAGVSGGVTGSSAQFAQNMVVNYVQQQGSDYIGQLVLKGLKEGGPVHAGLHAILGCAGAAASNQSCSAGALGGAAASVLTGLFSDPDPNETAADRETKRNLITSLVTAIAAAANPDGAATANNAAIANVDNNWLATQQEVQRDKELDAAPDLIEKLKVWRKWRSIDTTQNMVTGFGLIIGLQEGGWEDVEGIADFIASPMESLSGIRQFVESKELREKIGDAAVNSLLESIGRMEYALEYGGTDQALQLGRDIGKLLYTVGGLAVEIGGLAKGASALGKVGVEISSKALSQLVGKDGAKVGEAISQLEVSSVNNIKTVVTTKNLPKNSITNVRAISADEANAPFVAKGWNPPYDTGSQVRTFTTTTDIKFARVSTVDNPQGAFLVRADEIAGMTPQQIQQHLALPKVPTQVADVTVPPGTNMQVGRVAAQPEFGASSKGGVQYQLLGQIPNESFGIPRAL